MASFLIGAGVIVGSIIGLKVFFTLWRLLEKRLHPDDFVKPFSTPETAFRGLERTSIIIHMKNGEVLDCRRKRPCGGLVALAFGFWDLDPRLRGDDGRGRASPNSGLERH